MPDACLHLRGLVNRLSLPLVCPLQEKDLSRVGGKDDPEDFGKRFLKWADCGDCTVGLGVDVVGNGGEVSLGGVQKTVDNFKWPGEEGRKPRGSPD